MIRKRNLAINRWTPLAVAVAMTLGPALTLGEQSASAATSDPVQDSISFTQSGNYTDATLTLKSPTDQKLDAVTVAVRDSKNSNKDYPGASNVSISKGGVYTYKASKSFASGTYTMYGAYKIGNTWKEFAHYTVKTPVAAQLKQTSLTQSQSGTGTEAKLTLTSGSPYCQVAQTVTVAVRDAQNKNLDYPGQSNVLVCPGSPAYVFDATKALAPGTYTIYGAYQYNGQWTNFASQQVTVAGGTGSPGDTVPPSTPTGLTVGTVTSSSVALSWTASTDNVGVQGYNVYRDGVNVASNVSGTSYTDSGLAASTAHSYTVQATDQAGNASAQSAAVQATTSAGTTQPGTQPNGPTGNWNLKFADEFSGTSVDTSKWSFKSSAESDQSNNPLGTGNTKNQQLEFDQPGNCAVAGGELTITAKPDNITSDAPDKSGDPGNVNYKWSSCMINSSPSYAFQYGYFEARAQLPSQKGFWPALWTWQAPGATGCLNNGETDAFEYYSDNHTRLYLTQHQGTNASTVYQPSFDPSAGFHTYGVDLEPTGTVFYIDGKNVYQTSATQSCSANILLDMFVYSKIPPTAGTTEKTKVDYVRAWQH